MYLRVLWCGYSRVERRLERGRGRSEKSLPQREPLIWFKKRVLYTFWTFWTRRLSQIHLQVLQELASGKIVKLKVTLRFFFLPTKALTYLLPSQSTSAETLTQRGKSFPQ